MRLPASVITFASSMSLASSADFPSARVTAVLIKHIETTTLQTTNSRDVMIRNTTSDSTSKKPNFAHLEPVWTNTSMAILPALSNVASSSSVSSLAPTGSGYDYAFACQKSRENWRRAPNRFSGFPNCTFEISTSTSSGSRYITSTITEFQDVYTSCGITRAKSHTVRTITEEYSDDLSLVMTKWGPGCGSAPVCDFPTSDCNALWQGYVQSVISQKGPFYISLANPPSYIVFDGSTTPAVQGPITTSPVTITFQGKTYPPIPQILASEWSLATLPTTYRYQIELFEGDVHWLGPGERIGVYSPIPRAPVCLPDFEDGYWGGECEISADRVRLMYFPPPLDPSHRDYCAAPWAMNDTRAVGNSTWLSRSAILTEHDFTTIISGYPYDKRSAYISFEAISATAVENNQIVGRIHSGRIFALPSSRVSSIRYEYVTYASYTNRGFVTSSSYSFNWEDLNYPIPPVLYTGAQSGCLYYEYLECSTIAEDGYFPILAVPSELRAMDKAWATCNPALQGMYDPPITLTPVSVLAENTTPAPLFSVPHTPAGVHSSPQATKTNGVAPQPQRSNPAYATQNPEPTRTDRPNMPVKSRSLGQSHNSEVGNDYDLSFNGRPGDAPIPLEFERQGPNGANKKPPRTTPNRNLGEDPRSKALAEQSPVDRHDVGAPGVDQKATTNVDADVSKSGRESGATSTAGTKTDPSNNKGTRVPNVAALGFSLSPFSTWNAILIAFYLV